MRLFHYHLVTSQLRDVEARYLGRLGFRLIARHGRIGENHRSYESGTPWEELDRLGFRLRLSELERGAVNVVVQPGHWRIPRVDHLGLALDEDDLHLQRLHLRADDPRDKAKALAALLGLETDGSEVEVDGTVVRFVSGGPEGRPELDGELFD
jgi:hypothetical protein